jgi:hypothetical protein
MRQFYMHERNFGRLFPEKNLHGKYVQINVILCVVDGHDICTELVSYWYNFLTTVLL